MPGSVGQCYGIVCILSQCVCVSVCVCGTECASRVCVASACLCRQCVRAPVCA